MSELQIIETTLQRTARRRRGERAWRGFWQGWLWGCLLYLTCLIAFKLLPLPFAVLGYAALGGIACLAVGFLTGWWRRPSASETARWVDDRQRLQERLSTALEVAETQGAEEWRKLVVADAAEHAKRVDLGRLLPFRLPDVARWTVLVLAISTGLGFVPEYRSKSYLQKQREAANIRETGRQMAELVRRQLVTRPPIAEPAKKAMENVADLGERLSLVKLERNEALRDLANATDRLRQELKELSKSPDLKRLERAARSPSSGNEASASDLQKQMADLQKALGDKAANNPDALDKLKKDLQKLKDAAAGLPMKDSPAAAAAREQMAKSLASLAQQAKDAGLSLPDLDTAIEALKNNQVDAFLRDLNLATDDLEKMRQMAKALERLQQQMEKLGKDLAEQLDKGQAQAAQQTLQKMIEQLKAAGLPEDQLKKLMDEVDRAVQPGSQYGKVGEFLKSAVKQMRQGQKADAAQSLADAAQELQRLLDQLGDCQSLMASLEALQRAQMCIGNCLGWGQCKGGAPRHGTGKKPGQGFGDWRDDDSSLDLPEKQDFWENTLDRPKLDPRGITDRGAAELNENLAPTKVKGQFNPGAPTPSIPLKGVSIAGQSKVAIEQAVVAAQSEAESALNQDQVPRAYQGAVKDYFDDLK
jgi:hypothetical protein